MQLRFFTLTRFVRSNIVLAQEDVRLSLTTINFEGIAPAGSFTSVNGNTISGITFSTSHNLTVTDPGYGAPSYDYGTGATLTSYDFESGIYLHAPPLTMKLAGATAVGFLAAIDQIRLGWKRPRLS